MNLDYVIGLVQLYVRADAAEEARQLAESLERPAPGSDDSELA